MKVKEVMTQSAVCCSPDTNVGAAVELMWVRNCGMLPVVGTRSKAFGTRHGPGHLHRYGNEKPVGGGTNRRRDRHTRCLHVQAG